MLQDGIESLDEFVKQLTRSAGRFAVDRSEFVGECAGHGDELVDRADQFGRVDPWVEAIEIPPWQLVHSGGCLILDGMGT